MFVTNQGNLDIYLFVPRDVADTKMRAWKKQMASLPRHRQLEAERMQVVYYDVVAELVFVDFIVVIIVFGDE